MNDADIIYCQEYVKDFNQSRAYQVAHPDCSRSSARKCASRLMRTNADVKSYIDDLMAERIAETGIEARDVLRKLWGTVTADPNELIEIRRGCCRHCYGLDFKYQYTAGEWDNLIDQWEQNVDAAARDNRSAPREPKPLGGIGFHPRMPPMPECPECFGDGVEQVFIKDTRTLTPEARELYAGVKVTNKGIEIQKHSRDKALELLGRHLAMFTDNVDHKNNGGTFTPMTLSDFYAKPNTESGTP